MRENERVRVQPGQGALRSIGTLLTGSVTAQLVGLATMPIIARIYAPEAFGVFALFLSISALVGMVVALRYEYAIVLPDSDEDAVHLKRAATGIAMAVSLLTVVVTIICVIVIRGEGGPPWWILLLGGSVFLAGESAILYFWFTRTRRYRVQSASRVVHAVVAAAVQSGLGLTVLPGAEGLIVGYMAGQFVALAVLLTFDGSRRQRSRPNRGRARELLVRYRKMPLLNAPNALIDAVRLNGINLIIGAGSLHALGQFSMAWKLAQSPMALIAGSISQVYLQRMASAGRGRLRSNVLAVTRNALLGGLVPFGLLALLAPTLVPWLLGSQWAEAGLIVQALTPWLYLNVATAPLSNVFIIAERQGTMLAFATVYMAVPLLVLWLLGSDLLTAIWWMSASMSLLLLVLIAMSFVVAARYDSAASVVTR